MTSIQQDDYDERLARHIGDFLDTNDPRVTVQKYTDHAEKYEEDILSLGWVIPKRLAGVIAGLFRKEQETNKTRYVLDVGCGTGFNVEELEKMGISGIVYDGVDGSAGMLEIARRKNIYRTLETTFLIRGKESISFSSDTYDLVMACGILGAGRVYPTVLREFLRVTKPSGHVVFTIGRNQSDEYLIEMHAEIERMVQDGLWRKDQVVEFEYFSRSRGPGKDEIKTLLKCDVYCYVKC